MQQLQQNVPTVEDRPGCEHQKLCFVIYNQDFTVNQAMTGHIKSVTSELQYIPCIHY